MACRGEGPPGGRGERARGGGEKGGVHVAYLLGEVFGRWTSTATNAAYLRFVIFLAGGLPIDEQSVLSYVRRTSTAAARSCTQVP
eukprot:COSAG01_NODE_4794_length_4740_cov_1.812756_6_plen_85_part_00